MKVVRPLDGDAVTLRPCPPWCTEDDLNRVRLPQLLPLPGKPPLLLDGSPAARPLIRQQPVTPAMLSPDPPARPPVRRQRDTHRRLAIMDEAAARRQVGGRPVMAAHLARLREAAALPNVTLQVIPFAAGAHPGMPGSFIVLDFADPADQSIVYIDSMAGACSWSRKPRSAGIS